MITKTRHTRILITLAIIICIVSCTENPFGEDEISSGARQISGSVKLQDGSSPEGVYVWLESFNIGTQTDKSGQFVLSLPPKSSTGTTSGTSGTFNLYFYLANYLLDSSQVLIRESEFVFSRGDINKDGKLFTPKILRRFLRIYTTVSPSSVKENYTSNIQVSVTLTATNDSATVIIPNSINGLLGAVLVRRTDQQQVFIYRSSYYMETRFELLVGSKPKSIGMTFNLILTPLLPGTYEVVPYLLMAHQKIPQDLIDSIGQDVQGLNANYLKIPFQREGGAFEVKPNDR